MQEKFNDYVQTLETYIMFRIKETVAKITPELKAKGRSPISLSMGAPTAAPPKYLIDALKSALDEVGIHTYSTPRGEKFYREAIAKRMKERFNVELNPETEIFSLIGSKEGLANFIRVLLNPTTVDDDKEIIMVPDPGYASYGEMIKVSGGKAYSVPLTPKNNFMPDMDEVWENLIKEGYNPKKVKALLINYPNNPLGATATREYFQTLVDFCKKHNILLMSDAAYTDMYFKPELKPMSILEIEGAKDIAVEFFSFSKPYAITGWRLGWICGNENIVQRFGKGKSTIDNGIFKVLQFACADLMNSPEGDKYIEEGNLNYKKKQAIIVKGLKELGWPIDNIPHTTFYLWLPIPKKYDNAFAFCQDLLEKSGIVVVPGNAFGAHGEGYFRLSFVCSDEELQEVIDRMKADNFYYNAQ